VSYLGLPAILISVGLSGCGLSSWSVDGRAGTARQALDISGDAYCTVPLDEDPFRAVQRCGDALSLARVVFCDGYLESQCQLSYDNGFDDTKFAVLEFTGRTDYQLYEAFIDDRSIDRMELSDRAGWRVLRGTCSCSRQQEN